VAVDGGSLTVTKKGLRHGCTHIRQCVNEKKRVRCDRDETERRESVKGGRKSLKLAVKRIICTRKRESGPRRKAGKRRGLEKGGHLRGGVPRSPFIKGG